MGVRIQHRRDTAANWLANDPILAGGEIGWESDTNKMKIGNGAALWSALPYFSGAPSTGSILVWTSAQTWAQMYALVQAIGGICTMLVANDGTKEMTPDPMGATDLSGVLFVGGRGGAI